MKMSLRSVFRFATVALLLLGSHIHARAQNKTFGIGTSTLNPNAALQVDAPNGNQGVLIPRLTTTQRLAMKTTLAAGDAGLLVYDTTEKAVFVWVGTDWESSAAISWPLEDTITSVPNKSNLLNLTYSGTDTVGIALFRSTNPNNPFSSIFLESEGGRLIFGTTKSAVSPGADFRINNTANNQNAIAGSTNGSGRAIQGTNTGTGAAGNFTINNAANTTNAVFVQTNGTGPGVSMTLSNAANASPAININHNGTGNAITANRPVQASAFIGDGSQLTNIAAGDLTYPFKDSVTTTLTGNDVFALKYNNAANKRVLRVESLSPTNGSSAVSVQQNGTGLGIFSRIDNPASGSTAVYGTTNSNLGGALAPVGVYGESTGTGSSAAAFRIANTANNLAAVFVETNGSGAAINSRNIGASNGFAGLFANTIATNNFPAIQASTAGTGSGVRVIQNSTSLGRGMDVFMQNPSGTEVGISIDQQGLGSAGRFTINNAANDGPGLYISTSGIGSAIQAETSTGFATVSATRSGSSNGNAGIFQITDADNEFPALQVNTFGKGPGVSAENSGGTGNAGNFSIKNIGNGASAIYASTTGSGSSLLAETSSGFTAVHGRRAGSANGNAGFFEITDAANSFPTLQSNTAGTGSAGNFNVNNAGNAAPALFSSTSGTGAALQAQTSTGFTAIYGRREGSTNGSAGVFEITDAANSFTSLQSNTAGTGSAGSFKINNASNTASALTGETNGANLSTGVYGLNTGNGFGVLGRANGTSFGSAAVYGEQLGTGDAAGAFRINNPTNTMSGLYGETNGSGPALFSNNIGTGRGAQIQINNAANTQVALRAFTNGTGGAGFFTINNIASTANTLLLENNGTGSNIFLNHTGASGQLMVMQNSGTNVARIDKTGKGFFNGGTQTGGADVAEMFEVEGAREGYEPGDVLVISERTDRTVEKSSTPVSTKVVGVYATKPGLTLTERNLDESLSDMVPMGVIGVIPTKVCSENGPIKRGDLLVTSSKPGYAMKAVSEKGDGVFPSGAVIGKALENFEAGETGLINVLVNVK